MAAAVGTVASERARDALVYSPAEYPCSPGTRWSGLLEIIRGFHEAVFGSASGILGFYL